MRCGVDLGPNFTERGNFFGNSFHLLIIPWQTLKRSPRFGGNEPFLGRLALGGRLVPVNIPDGKNAPQINFVPEMQPNA